MADKMLRVAGRSTSGVAKPIKTTELGEIQTTTARKIELVDVSTSFNAGTSVTTKKVATGDAAFSNGVLNLNLTHPRKIRVKIVRQTETEPNYFVSTEQLLFTADAEDANFQIPYEVKSPLHYFVIENIDTRGTNIFPTTHAVLSNTDKTFKISEKIDNSIKSVKHDFNKKEMLIDTHVAILPNESLNTRKISTKDLTFTTGILNLNLTHNKKVSVKIVHQIETEPNYFVSTEEMLFTADVGMNSYQIPYEIKTPLHYFVIENTDTTGLNVFPTTHAVLSNMDRNQKRIDELINVNRETNTLIEQLKELNKTKKRPKTTLKFKKSNLPELVAFDILDDNKAVVVTGANVVMVYDDITSETPTIVTTGTQLVPSDIGRIANIRWTLDGGLLLFTNTGTQARIYKMANFNAQPVLKYESQTTSNTGQWALRNQFGVKSYHNGMKTMILAGVYGKGQDTQDLLLSTDNGDTFNVIKTTSNLDTSGNFNSHWHDVEFDVYNGRIWASEGDSAINRNVWYSDNMGQTWKSILPANATQPTTLTAFPDKLLMGRDSERPGFEVVHNINEPYSVLREFKASDTVAIHYYAHSPIVDGDEAYFAFSIDGKEPRLLMATGDFGESLHFVFMGYGTDIDGNSISSLVGLDSQYVYGFGSTGLGDCPLLFAERVKWV